MHNNTSDENYWIYTDFQRDKPILLNNEFKRPRVCSIPPKINNHQITYCICKETPVKVRLIHEQEKGLLIIFNNIFFASSSKLETRNGSEEDVTKLQCTFTNLGYKVVVKRNRSVVDILEIVRRISQLGQLINHNAIFITVLSHGNANDKLYGSCGNTFRVEQLIEPFRGGNCPLMVGKPKVFLINACRGTLFDSGVRFNNFQKDDRTDDTQNKNNKRGSISLNDAKNANTKIETLLTQSIDKDYIYLNKIPDSADILIAFSCVAGYYSWRNQQDGSWFIQLLCKEILNADHKREDFLRILTKTSAAMAFTKESNCVDLKMNGKKQVPCIVSTLTKSFFFE